MYQLDYLANHPNLVEPVTVLGFNEFGYLNPGQTLSDRLAKIQTQLNYDKLPITFVAFEDNQLIGTATLRQYDLDNYQHVTPWLASVIVVPERRGQGIGTWLVKETMKFAFKLDVDTWYLYTPSRENFYAQMGWETIDTAEYNNVPGVIMRLEKK